MDDLPFSDSRAKIENAREHIETVKARFSAFATANPTVIERSSTSLKIRSPDPIPKTVRVAVGDVLHNLRSALDIMAGDVVQASGKSRSGVYFPFARSETEIDEQIRNKKFDRAIPAAVTLLKAIKPFRGGNEALRALHDLNVSDKHTFIIPTAQSVHIPFMQMDDITFTNCSFGGQQGPFLQGNSPGVVRGTPVLEMRFGANQPLRLQEVIPALEELAQLTSAIVEAFAALFDSGLSPAAGAPAA